MADSYFRGTAAIRDALSRIRPLAEWTLKFKPEQRHLVLRRADYDVIKRWPRAASTLGFMVTEVDVLYVDPTSRRQLELYPDTGRGRYERRVGPRQTDIEAAP